jgi:hypothetical protein
VTSLIRLLSREADNLKGVQDEMIREILGIALIAVGLISLIAHFIAIGRRATTSEPQELAHHGHLRPPLR